MSYKLPENWEIFKIEDIVKSISKRPKLKNEYIIPINTSDVFNGKVLQHNKIKNKDLPGQFKKTFDKNDILFSEIRPINGRNAFVDFNSDNYIASTKLMVLRTKESILNPIFFYRWITSHESLRYLQLLAETRSGTFPQIRFNEIKNMTINVPSLKEQKAIADTLSALDDKIELNNKINKKLEEQAQLLFKHWFVDFEFPNEEGLPYKSNGGEMVDSELGMIPKEWEIVKFKEMFEFIKGKVPEYVSKKEDNSSPYLTKTVLDGEWVSVKYGITHTGVEANALDILMLMDGANSSDIYYGYNGLIGSTFSLLKTEDENIREILYMYLTINNNEIKRQNTGSAIPHANKHYINSIKLAIPKNKEKLKIITDYFKLYRYKKIKNDKQNKKLSEIRDTLLPKLMSGEVRIPID